MRRLKVKCTTFERVCLFFRILNDLADGDVGKPPEQKCASAIRNFTSCVLAQVPFYAILRK